MISVKRSLRITFATFCLSLLCACNTPQTAERPRFHEESKADVVVQFPGWEAISITRPATGEAGFIPFYTRTDAERRLAQMMTQHHLAVIVCNFTYSPAQQAEHQKAWGSFFAGLGFQRVVFLKAGLGSRLNGLEVLRDLQLASESRVGS